MTTSSLYLASQMLIGEQLRRAAYKTGNQEVFVFKDKRITYKEMEVRALHVAAWLQSEGIEHQEKVGFILRNCTAFVDCFFGASLSGAVAVPINFRLGPEELAYIIHNSDTKILVIEKENINTIKAIKSKIPNVEKILVTGAEDIPLQDMSHFEEIFKSDVTYTPDEQLTDNDPAVIMYTSGTTGKPKGAVLTHKAICHNALNMMYESKTEDNQQSVQLVVTPLFHISVLSGLAGTCMSNSKMVIFREYAPQDVLETIEKERITSLFLVPTMWNQLLQLPNLDDYDLSSMKRCTTGGAICPLEIKKKIMKCFPNAGIYDGFGQTETSSATTMLKPEDSLVKTNSVGKALINIEIRVVDENMNDVPVGEVGEIIYRGPNLLKEYYKQPEETEKAFRGGWFHSGDLVRQDEEGFVYVVDRKKDMIISGGENIYPAEIEEILYEHPSIYECAVIGVPDQQWGETVKAFIVLKPGKTATEEEIINFCKSKLASYKKPKLVEFIDELPRNASGKILKRTLRDESVNQK